MAHLASACLNARGLVYILHANVEVQVPLLVKRLAAAVFKARCTPGES